MIMTALRFIQTFLNNNLGVVTFIVGFLAIYLYIKQKNDRKRDAASLILQEIRYAEQQIRHYKNSAPNQYNLADRLLPTNSWNDNIHLFIKDLEENEIDMISAFYAKAKYIDFLILKRSEQKTSPHQQPSFPVPVQGLPLQPGQTQEQTGPQVVQFSLPILNVELVTNDLLRQTSYSVELIYNTPVVGKLRKISNRKWYHII